MGRILKAGGKKDDGGRVPGDLSDRRAYVRLKRNLGVNCKREFTQFKAMMLDMGVGGLQIETRARFVTNDELFISPAVETPGFSRAGIRCRVMWVSNPEAGGRQRLGVRFDESDEVLRGSWVNYVLYYVGVDEEAYKQKRRFRRIPSKLRAEAATGQRMVRGVVLNLSLGGAALQIPEALPHGQDVLLAMGPHQHLEVLQIRGRAINSRPDPNADGRFINGIAFESPNKQQTRLLEDYLRALLVETSSLSLTSQASTPQSS